MEKEVLILLGVLFGLWIIWFIILPFYVLTEKFIENRIRETKTAKKIAKKLKGKTKEETLENVYKYINKNYYGQGHMFDYNSFPEVFNFNISNLLSFNKNRFLWCSNQIALITSLLINTGQFTKEDIYLKRTLGKTLSAHFYSQVNIGKKKYYVDPYYDVFKLVK